MKKLPYLAQRALATVILIVSAVLFEISIWTAHIGQSGHWGFTGMIFVILTVVLGLLWTDWDG
jgi:hypothetical protein